ncbi:MAG TPA: uracil-DNA glycosylase family protein [Thermomicrobiaceae bacterium]|nr:uracil-DNA glycosylase family protein [Thermomicrobiaceae bacterium]
MPQPTPVTGNATEVAERQEALVAHQRRMHACTACVDAGFIVEAWPVFLGHARHRIMVVGQAPAVRRDEHPLPYSGASGRLLRRWLARAGFPDDALHERCYLTSLTKCFPGSSAGGKGDRAPTAREVALCRPNLERELALVRPEVILALGRLAAARFAGQRPLDELVGNVFEHEGAVVIPLPHPSGVSRWLNDPANQALLDRALAALSRIRVEREL